MTTTAREAVANFFRIEVDHAKDPDSLLAALAANPEALLAWVREAVPGVVAFVDGPEVRERVARVLRHAIFDCESGSDPDEEDVAITATLFAALTTGGAT